MSVDFFSIKDASVWASQYLAKNVNPSNISYLIQYGRINKYYGMSGALCVSKNELINYYELSKKKESDWKKKLGHDINWNLSFSGFNEKETTKHVHRLHSYKGKFIPQLVHYFLDEHTDVFKTSAPFKKGDVILDPFCGSGTTLVEANELGIHAIGIDISEFNSLISNIKISQIDFFKLEIEIKKINKLFDSFIFNKKNFPAPEYKIKVLNNEILEKEYAKKKELEFLGTLGKLEQKYQMQIKQNKQDTFLGKWYLKHVRDEIDFLNREISKISFLNIKNVLQLILSRTVRSSRATTHEDLASLKEQITKTYYCKKHGKICKPLYSINRCWKRYIKDTINRLKEFSSIKTNTNQYCLKGDARTIDLTKELQVNNSNLAQLIKKQKIKGIFSSPPYVGLINYHEQHAYAYELFRYKRNDNLEIGSLFQGQGQNARTSYVEEISKVLINIKKYLQKDYDIFLVANDKYNLYQKIAIHSNMQIVNTYKRPVLNRTEKNKNAYSENIFHLKENPNGYNTREE